MDKITIINPFDAHLHLRQGAMLRTVLPHSAGTFSGAIVKPNVTPPVRRPADLIAYRREIMDAAVGLPPFEPFLTGYFDPEWTRGDLEGLKAAGMIAAKFYPKGLTTNSEHGCDPANPDVLGVLSNLSDLGIPLCVHAEMPGPLVQREYLFHDIITDWSWLFPDLKIVIEHISDAMTLNLVWRKANIHGTVTPHHLMLTEQDWAGPPFRPHNYCMPVAKQGDDRDALIRAVTGQDDEPVAYSHKLMLGTDSAPHPIGKKEAAECCAGVFNAPVALQLVAQVFAGQNRLDRMQAFCSNNARRIYGIDFPEKYVTLTDSGSTVPRWFTGFKRSTGEAEIKVVPFMAGQTIPWGITSITTP